MFHDAHSLRKPCLRSSPTVDSEPSGLSATSSRHGHPLSLRKRPLARRSRRNDQASGHHEPSGQGKQLLDVAGASHDDRVEALRQLFCELLGAAAHDAHALESELSHGTRQERHSPLARLEENELDFGSHDLDRDSWQTRAGPEIEQRAEPSGENPEEEQAVEEEIFDDPARLGGANEALGLLPFSQQFQVFDEQVALAAGQWPTENRLSTPSEDLERAGVAGSRGLSRGRRLWPRAWRGRARAGPCTTAGRSGARSTRSSRARAPTAGSGT